MSSWPADHGDGQGICHRPGDTLGAIAHKNGISLKALMEANPGVNPKKLQIGQKIQIPPARPRSPPRRRAGAGSPDMAARRSIPPSIRSNPATR